MASKFLAALKRKKHINFNEDSPLKKCLNLLDLTALGVGATLGLGAYVLAGSVAKNVAGPAVCISFLVAAIASVGAGLCYAEFAARVPKAGSAYVYSYVSVGEFVAFFIGWNLILEYVIGTASVASGMSNYINSLVDNKIKDTLQEWMPMNVSFLSPYPDFLSFIFVMILTFLLAFGVKESSLINNVFTVINLVTICLAVAAGSIKATPDNWKIDVNTLSEEDRGVAGAGGFMPFGISGIMAGAARCFYGFIGFDAIATTGEEAKNPQRDIPLAVILSLTIIFAAYFSISTSLTMALPYYLQDPNAPYPHLFDAFGWTVIKWVVTIGAIFALCTSMLGAMFPLPRVLYAMSKDGIIFKQLSKVNEKTKTPVLATFLSGFLSSVMAVVFNLDQLIDMMSIGTLLAYTIVAVSVLLLRYEPAKSITETVNKNAKEKNMERFKYTNIKHIFNLNGSKYPTNESSTLVNWSIVLFSVFSAFFGAIIVNGGMLIIKEPIYIFAFTVIVVCIVLLMVIMIRQPQSDAQLSFKVPLVPYVPCLSIAFNLFLMFQLDLQTWIRFIVWLIIGFLIYFLYGIKQSEENKRRKNLLKEQELHKVQTVSEQAHKEIISP
ncbi:unnamed protein product [Phyllotreta striolata]|uniref:Cationic amino acid transporter C-terminal domain-containing protein n=1 Tax=Phyllotreta striolata TaxID=444603 RepID=A0A9N9TX20_PHYSR|nr:unnamed protein product [Phyllotreta striolata]